MGKQANKVIKNDDWVKKLATLPRNGRWSQNGEDGIIEFILKHILYAEGTVLDLGAGDGFALSNSRYFIEDFDFTAYLVDGNPRGTADVHKAFITRENVGDILKEIGCPKKDLTFMTLDLDGNDFDIIEAVLKAGYKPRLIVAEINGCIPAGVSKKIKYNPDHVWGDDDYYGFSFAAAKILAERNGYKVIHQNDGVNVYLLRKEELANPEADIEVPFVHLQYHKHNPKGEWEEVV